MKLEQTRPERRGEGSNASPRKHDDQAYRAKKGQKDRKSGKAGTPLATWRKPKAQSRPQQPVVGERYFGIWPQTSLEPLVHDVLSSALTSAHLTELAKPVRQAIEKELAQFPMRYARDADAQPRVVVMHNSDLKRDKSDEATAGIWRAIWAKFQAMGDRPDSPDYRLAFDYLVFDDSAMALTVKHCNPRTDDPIATEELDFWSLPAGSESRFIRLSLS